MMKVKLLLLSLTLSLSGLLLIGPRPAHAALFNNAVTDACGGANLQNGSCTPSSTGFLDTIQKVANTIIFLAGALAVVMLIVGGIRYITSAGGDGAKAATQTIIYAVVGLVVAIVAFAIVNFVINALT